MPAIMGVRIWLPFYSNAVRNVWRGPSARNRCRLLATAADIGGSIIQPSPRCVVTPSGDREARPRIDIRARTFRRGVARPRVTHLCSVGRGAQEHQETHRQNRAHRSAPIPQPPLSDTPVPHNLCRLHNYEKEAKARELLRVLGEEKDIANSDPGKPSRVRLGASASHRKAPPALEAGGSHGWRLIFQG